MTYVPDLVYGQVLWDSVLFRYRSTLRFSSGSISGFEPINCADWRDFSVFRPTPGGYLSLTVSDALYDSASLMYDDTSEAYNATPVASSADTVVIWPVAGVTGSVRVSNGSGTWLTGYIQLDGSGSIVWTDVDAFNPAGTLRIHFFGGTAPDIRLIAIGPKVTFPIGQWSQVNPPNLTQGLVVENLIAINGSIVARNIRRVEKQGKINLEHLTPGWVRTVWEPFAAFAARYAFFHRWDPVGHPTEVAFSVANEIVPPTNTKAGRMTASMPTRFIT